MFNKLLLVALINIAVWTSCATTVKVVDDGNQQVYSRILTEIDKDLEQRKDIGIPEEIEQAYDAALDTLDSTAEDLDKIIKYMQEHDAESGKKLDDSISAFIDIMLYSTANNDKVDNMDDIFDSIQSKLDRYFNPIEDFENPKTEDIQ